MPITTLMPLYNGKFDEESEYLRIYVLALLEPEICLCFLMLDSVVRRRRPAAASIRNICSWPRPSYLYTFFARSPPLKFLLCFVIKSQMFRLVFEPFNYLTSICSRSMWMRSKGDLI